MPRHVRGSTRSTRLREKQHETHAARRAERPGVNATGPTVRVERGLRDGPCRAHRRTSERPGSSLEEGPRCRSSGTRRRLPCTAARRRRAGAYRLALPVPPERGGDHDSVWRCGAVRPQPGQERVQVPVVQPRRPRPWPVRDGRAGLRAGDVTRVMAVELSVAPFEGYCRARCASR